MKNRKNRNIIITLFLLLCLVTTTFLLVGCSSDYDEGYDAGYSDGYNAGYDAGYDDGYADAIGSTTEVTYTTEYTATHYADIVIDGYGTITVALDANQAPITVENFVTLANEGFYDGLTFHRIMDGFMMQGGDPNGDGTGGNTDEDGNEINIEGEFYYNGSDNMLSHIRGAISMARGNDYDSASSQFFIVHTSDYTSSLDGLYAVFGYVTEGLDIVDAICEATYTFEDDGETVVTDEQPVITSITIREVDESEDESEETTAIEAKVAEVTAITDGTLTLTTYTLTEAGADYEITDAASVDFTNYEASSETEEYTIDSAAVLYVSADGTLTESDSTAIVVGDKLVIYTDSDDITNIVIYHAESEETTAIEAKVAEVTAITDGTLTLTTYTLTEAGADYEITDAASVDFTNYEVSSETEKYTIDSAAVIYVSEDGTLAESDSTAIVVGDKLVIYNDSDDVITIVIYHAESEQNTDES